MEQNLTIPVMYGYDHSRLIGKLVFEDTPEIREMIQMWADGKLTMGKSTAQYTLEPNQILDVSLIPVLPSEMGEEDDDE